VPNAELVLDGPRKKSGGDGNAAEPGVVQAGVVNRNGAGHLDAAFEQFVVDRSATLLRTAYLLVGDRAEAEDLVQTAGRGPPDGHVAPPWCTTRHTWPRGSARR
jgi:hypothetical protein